MPAKLKMDMPMNDGNDAPNMTPRSDDEMTIPIEEMGSQAGNDYLQALDSDTRKVRELIRMISALLGKDLSTAILGKIPKIVVVGDQSAGKSSVSF